MCVSLCVFFSHLKQSLKLLKIVFFLCVCVPILRHRLAHAPQCGSITLSSTLLSTACLFFQRRLCVSVFLPHNASAFVSITQTVSFVTQLHSLSLIISRFGEMFDAANGGYCGWCFFFFFSYINVTTLCHQYCRSLKRNNWWLRWPRTLMDKTMDKVVSPY